MSKKKNTLKDLDEFLKQQAAVIVPPAALNKTIDDRFPESPSSAQTHIEEEITVEKVIRNLNTLSRKEGNAFRKKLYDIIIGCLEANPNASPEDKMLINTALYLKGGDNWEEVIREYWRAKVNR